jgi:hypothetical protein
MNLLLPNSPLLAAADLQEIVFVIVFLVVGFLQWLFSLLKKNKEAAERDRQLPVSTEEQEARRRAWAEQTRPVDDSRAPQAPPTRIPAPPQLPRSTPPPAPSARPAPASTTPGSLADLMDTLRRSIDDVSSPRPAAAPSVPAAPVRPPVLPGAARVASHPVPASHPARMTRAAAAQQSSDSTDRPILATVVAPRRSHPLTDMLKTTHGYKQAFILREVLGPCKALEGQD